MPKHRREKVKREHRVLPEVLPLLEQVGRCPLVASVLPGEIAPRKGPAVQLTFQYPTETGLKLLAKSTSAVQEVFVVTADAAGTRRWLEAQRLLAPQPSHDPETPVRHKSVMVKEATACPLCGRPMQAGTRGLALGGAVVHVFCARRRGE